MSRRFYPNILITGTPGCGKTSHSESLSSQLAKPYKHFSISDIAKSRDCIEGYDEKLDTSVVDENRLLDSLENDLREGGIIIDWHCCDIFPERLIDLVVVLRTDNNLLYERMKKRGYKDNKIQENLDCEIMEVILQEARDAYRSDIVVELQSNCVEEMEENIDRISAWVANWKKDHKNGESNELQGSESGSESDDASADEISDESDDDHESDTNTEST